MNDLSELIIFSTIENQEAAKNNLDLFLDIAGGSKTKEFSKQKTKQFLNLMLHHLQSKEGSGKSKFYSLYMIKLVIERSENKILSVLASHSLLKYLHQLAKQTDPNKPITEKGKSLFPDKQIGNDYIRLVLQALRVLAEKSRSSNQQPTKFKKFYDELIDMKIVLPKQLKFFDEGMMGYSRTQKKPTSANEVSSITAKSQSSFVNPKDTPRGQQKYKQDVQMSLSKINTFVQVLKTQQDPESLRQQCQMYHKRFLKETQKYQKIISTIDYTGDSGVHMILALNDFYVHEAELYQKYLANQKDYYSYTPEVLMAAETMYQAMGTNPPEGRQSEKQMKAYQQPPSQTSMRRNNHISDGNQDNKQLVSQLMSKLDQKSRSPNVGFKSIKESLSKQKSLSRNKRSVSGLKRSNATKFGKSISKSRISQIFTSPPNPYPKQRRYEGQIVEDNSQLGKVMKDITKKQGIRRFITCNFKQKNPLFQNSHIQIGVKSEGIYEDVNDFKVLIGIELYIGNKTQDLIKNMSISYKGSQDVLLYGNPRTIETVLQGGYQHKHQLLIVPLNYYFPFIKMFLKYTVNDQTVYENITLPNSMLKLASHGNISKRDFVAMWNASTIYRTPQFKYTRYLPPDTLSKYIKPLQQLTPYQKFIIKGSQTDYELGCQVILKQRYQGVLRINIRPNFNAVIQVAVAQQTQQAIQSFIFYAQTLQMLLTHIDHQEL